jgi:hypothetical protein
MTFISWDHSKKIAEWENKYPEKAKAYFMEMLVLSDCFITKKINYDEFKAKSDAIKEKYDFLGR